MFMVLLKSKDMVYNIADEASETSIKQLAETLVSLEPEKGLKVVMDIPEQPDLHIRPGNRRDRAHHRQDCHGEQHN